MHVRVDLGDTLSTLLQRLNRGRIYGDHGLLKVTIRRNPNLRQDFGNKLHPGDVVELPSDIAFFDHENVGSSPKPSSETSESPVTTRQSIDNEIHTSPLIDSKSETPLKSAAQEPAQLGNQRNQPTEVRSQLMLRLGVETFSLQGYEPANGTSGRLLSNTLPIAILGWQLSWDETLETELNVKLRNVEIQPEQTGVSISDLRRTEIFTRLSVSQKLGNAIRARVAVENGPAIFYHGLAGGGLQLDHVPLWRLNPEIEWRFAERGPLSASLIAGVSIWQSGQFGSYSIEPGYGSLVGLRFEHTFQKSSFDCQLTSSERAQKSSILELKEKLLSTNCGMRFEL